MADKKSILLLIPDGIGLRNFVYTGFYDRALERGVGVTYWNGSPLDLSALGYPEVRFDNNPVHPLTNILKYVKTRVELTRNRKRSGDKAYESYYFPPPLRNLNDRIKRIGISLALPFYNSEKGILRVQRLINRLERTTRHYRESRRILEQHKPGMVFCTNQRHLSTVGPIMAARDLGIPTGVFIFSWDNLPKATLFVEADYYFVWSDYMKAELLKYYPAVDANRVMVTGTPQFDPHANQNGLEVREDFFQRHGLNPRKRYVCFSGDDVTTSPHDPVFLRDTARAVRQLNSQGENLGVIFRRCPVDFSDRYDGVLREYSDVVFPLTPKWEKAGGSWGHVIPTADDLILQVNTIAHSEMVINLGSSMVFDFVTFGKPCAFVNYNVASENPSQWSVEKVYDYIHFRSMPDKNAVIWLNSPDAIADAIKSVLSGRPDVVRSAKDWFHVVTRQPAGKATDRVIDACKNIIEKG